MGMAFQPDDRIICTIISARVTVTVIVEVNVNDESWDFADEALINLLSTSATYVLGI